MKVVYRILTLLLFILGLGVMPIESKFTQCRNRFKLKENWVYCTKFGAATSGKVRVKMRTIFLAKNPTSTSI
jgi:hypothetical protein